MSIIDINIETLLPQKKPFLLIDSLIESNDESTQSCFLIQVDNLFVEHNSFREAGLVENIAQTVAARAGYISVQNNKPVLLGYIGSIKNLEIHHLPLVGEKLITEVKILNQIFNVTIIEGKVFSGNRLIANCEMKIFINNTN